jgi:hypothetical protein
MNRRHALAGLAGAASGMVLAAKSSPAQPPKSPIPRAMNFEMGKALNVAAKSSPFKLNDSEFHIIGVGKATFRLDNDSRLTATLKAGVMQYAKVDYWISTAVFDAAGKLLGTASHKEPVEYIRLGATPTVFREIELDFGVSKAFKNAAFVVIAISEPEVPKPG